VYSAKEFHYTLETPAWLVPQVKAVSDENNN